MTGTEGRGVHGKIVNDVCTGKWSEMVPVLVTTDDQFGNAFPLASANQ